MFLHLSILVIVSMCEGSVFLHLSILVILSMRCITKCLPPKIFMCVSHLHYCDL